MRKWTLMAALLLIMASAFSQNQRTDIPTGKVTLDEYLNYKGTDDFNNRYDAYQPKKNSIRTLRKFPKDYKVLIFGGAWCPATERGLPQIYKVFDEAGINREQLSIYLVNRKFDSPENLEDQFSLTGVPTFIVMDGDELVDRFMLYIEQPIEKTLEDIVTQLYEF